MSDWQEHQERVRERRERNKKWRVRAACAWLVCVIVGGLIALVTVYGTDALYPMLWVAGSLVTLAAVIIALSEGIDWSSL